MQGDAPNTGTGIPELAKAAAGLPWAISLFGLHQTADLLNPRSRSQDPTGAAGGFDAVTSAIVEQFSENLKTTFDVGDRVQGQIIDAVFGVLSRTPATAASPVPLDGRSGAPIFSAKSRANEEVIISYTRGQGRFSEDRRFITLNNKIYLLDGREFGVHQGVWERQFESAQELMAKPNPPSPPLNEPVGPVEKGIVSAQTKAVWAFRDGEVFSVGPAASHLIPLQDGSFLFLVSTAQVVTHGTGRFDGVYGLTQSLGATHVPRGVDLFRGENKPFPAATLDTFKLRIVKIPPAPSPVTAPHSRSQPPVDLPTQAPPTSPTSKYVDVCGSRMHYVDVGTGDPVLFLHGNPGWSYLWRNVIPHVAPSARCIAPDLIGMGRSDKPDISYRFVDHAKYLDGFISALGLRNVTLVTHDWGCILGLFYAMRNAANVKGLAFMEATFRPFKTWNDFPEGVRATFQAFRTPDIGFEKVVVRNEFIEQILPGSIMRKLSNAEMDMYRFPFRNPADRKVIWKFANELPIAGKPPDVVKAVADYSSWLKETDLPKLLLYAEPGAITTAKDVQWARENLKHVKTVSVGKGIHFLQEDNPDAIGQEIAKWYSTLAKRRS
jgi:haloalkane dehalogenase